MMDISRRELLKMAGGVVITSGMKNTTDISVRWDFEGGNLGKVELAGTDHYRCHVKGQVDQDGRNRQANWYYFRVDHAQGHALTFDLVDLAGEYNYQRNPGAITKDTLPFFSSDGITWQPVEEAIYDPGEPKLQFRITVQSEHLWLAHVPPYTTVNLAALLRDISATPYVKSTTIGKSVEGRTIPLVTITDSEVPDNAKKVIWLMFRQHAWEAGSSWTGEGLMRFVTSSDSRAEQIRRETILKILPLCDPDGVVNGTVRFNHYGYDLNRNWDLIDPVKMPEITAERRAILDWVDSGNRVDFFLTVHNDETNEYIQGPPNKSGSLRPLLNRVSEYWSTGATFAATKPPSFDDVSTTVGKPGRMNVVQGLYQDRKLPGFEVEMRIVKHPKLGRRPNIEDRKRAGEELVQAIWKGLDSRKTQVPG
jgi:Zinc carboxypeptidase/Cytosolic carboxypeptidase N-terminal domain